MSKLNLDIFHVIDVHTHWIYTLIGALFWTVSLISFFLLLTH